MQLLVFILRCIANIAMQVKSVSSPFSLFILLYLLHVGYCWEIWGHNVDLSGPKTDEMLKFIRNPYCYKYECCNANWIKFSKRSK